MLNITKVEPIADPNMYILFEKCVRGGVSKNKYLKSYDPKKQSKNIIYLDVNNLYGMQCLSFFQQMDSNGYILKSLT